MADKRTRVPFIEFLNLNLKPPAEGGHVPKIHNQAVFITAKGAVVRGLGPQKNPELVVDTRHPKSVFNLIAGVTKKLSKKKCKCGILRWWSRLLL